MRQNDYDVDDFLIHPKKDIDEYEEEESEGIDLENDGDVFFEVVEKDN